MDVPFVATYARPEWAHHLRMPCGHAVAATSIDGRCMACDLEARQRVARCKVCGAPLFWMDERQSIALAAMGSDALCLPCYQWGSATVDSLERRR